MLEPVMTTHIKGLAKEIDNKMYKFLEDNGYYLERNNVEQIIKLRDELAKEDKQIRCETTIVSFNINEPYEVKTHGLIFFDSISNPLSKEEVDELILKDYYKKNNIDEQE